MRRPGWPLRWPMLALPCAAVLGWLAGFAWFVQTAFAPTQPPPHCDGIVVLTGGADRVEVGFRLLRDNAADLLLVSGVGRAADFPELAHRAGIDVSLAPRVTLGRTAASTRGNATETAEWSRAHHMTSLIVVTAAYHMPRALTELRQTLPNVALHPVTVQPPGMKSMRNPLILRLLAGEYTKLIAVELGLAGLAGQLGFGTAVEHAA